MCDMWEVIKNQIFAFDNVNVIDLTLLLNQFEKLKKKAEQELVEEIWLFQFNKLGDGMLNSKEFCSGDSLVTLHLFDEKHSDFAFNRLDGWMALN